MKKVIFIKTIVIIIGLSINNSAFSQSTFNTETLKVAIENYVKSHNPLAINVEIKQTLSPQKFSQQGVIASITHSEELSGSCKVNLIFSYNDQVLSRAIVRINVTTTPPKSNFNQVKINKGDNIKLLHYSGAVCIKTNGVAMESGNTGSVIKVKKDNSQTLYGFIAEDGNVIIEDKNILVNNKLK